MTYEIAVENIKCGGCMNTIKTALMKIKGVEVVDIDKETEIITVDGNAEKSILLNTLSGLGYPEKGQNNILKKARSYVSCTIGKMN